MTMRPRRSVLYMPANKERALAKAKTLPVDGLIIDLEDSVAPDVKPQAREQAIREERAGGFGNRELFLRINALDTAWGKDDLSAACGAGFDGVIVPKVSTVDQIESIAKHIGNANPKLRVWIMIETPLAILNLASLAAAAQTANNRLTGFVMGTNDLAKETSAQIVHGRAPMRSWLSSAIIAARAYGLEILDGVYNDIADLDGFNQECRQARDMGFTGKTLIHPNQVEPCNAAFSPSPEEITEARRILNVFDRPENIDKGVVLIEGRMVERMHADMARRTMALVEAIGKN